MPYRKRKKPLRGIGEAFGPFCPIRPNVIWALDFQFDQTTDGRMLKVFNVIDEYTREALATDVARSIDADGVVAFLERLAPQRGAPVYVRFDHGPEFIAYALSDWCRFNGTGTVFIDPGSPWQNAWIECFNGRMRDEHLNGQLFDILARGPGPHRGLADRLQHEQAPHRARLAHPGRVRRAVAQPTTATARIASGSNNRGPASPLVYRSLDHFFGVVAHAQSAYRVQLVARLVVDPRRSAVASVAAPGSHPFFFGGQGHDPSCVAPAVGYGSRAPLGPLARPC